MKFGPAQIGETVATIWQGVAWSGLLLSITNGVASIGVLGYSETLKVPFNSVAPVR